jgi:TusA-related sulfurtransferase
MSEDLATIKVEKVVDARGTSCPGPILAAKKGIPSVSVGGVMEVQSTDSGSMKDLPAWAKKMGHEFLGTREEPGYLRLFIKKMK